MQFWQRLPQSDSSAALKNKVDKSKLAYFVIPGIACPRVQMVFRKAPFHVVGEASVHTQRFPGKLMACLASAFRDKLTKMLAGFSGFTKPNASPYRPQLWLLNSSPFPTDIPFCFQAQGRRLESLPQQPYFEGGKMQKCLCA